MIVEDEDSLRETLSRYLAHEGHEVIATASGYEALEAGFDATPDVLIADWMLKNHIHGLHVSEVFRALHPRLNTILITGFPSRDLLEESDRCGVSRLLEKPFDLEALNEALVSALMDPSDSSTLGPPIAAMAVSGRGAIEFASQRACELFEAAGAASDLARLDQLIDCDASELLGRAEADWIEVTPRTAPGQGWSLRSRKRAGNVGWLVVVCPREEEQRRSDPRVRILLDVRSETPTRRLVNPGPVVVLERDGVVRRLLVSQIERMGAICYPSDDLSSALRLLAAEPRAQTVMIDFALAGSEMAQWCERIRAARPNVSIIGTGGVGSETDLLAQGVQSVLRKPWRIRELLEAIEGSDAPR